MTDQPWIKGCHTPEPWQAERFMREGYSPDKGLYERADTYITVCCGPDYGDDESYLGANRIEVHGRDQEANARLVAAAPRLLATLREFANNSYLLLGDNFSAVRDLIALAADLVTEAGG
jgi:hypothetical protein